MNKKDIQVFKEACYVLRPFRWRDGSMTPWLATADTDLTTVPLQVLLDQLDLGAVGLRRRPGITQALQKQLVEHIANNPGITP